MGLIHPSDKWRFVEPAGDKGFFEDDIVQHIVTEHRALRRAMSEKVSSDPVCAEEIRQQAALAATYNAPALPRIYTLEVVKGRITIVMEQITGTALDDEINHQKFVKAYDWAQFAVKLVDELLELRQSNTRFHKLATEYIVLQDSGDIRITSRWPVGTVSSPTLDSSQMLQRMCMQPKVGVYTSTAPANEAGEIEAVKQIFTRMAAGSTRHTFEQLRDEAQQNSQMHPSGLAGVDGPIARIILGMQPRPQGSGEYTNLYVVQAAVKDLCDEEARRISAAEDHAANMRAQAMHQHSNVSNLYAAQAGSSEPQMRASSPQVQVYRDPVTGAPKDPVTGSYRDVASGLREQMKTSRDSDSAKPKRDPVTAPDDNPYAPQPLGIGPLTNRPAVRPDPATGPRRDSRSGNPVRASASTDDINPYADHDSGGAPSPMAAVVSAATTPVPKQSFAAPRGSGSGAKKIVPIVIGILALAAVAAGVIFVLPMLKSKPPNTKPIAAIAPIAASIVAVNEIIQIDATPSTDAENDKLTYYWERKAPADGRVSITEAGTNVGGERTEFATQSSKIEAQFFNTGEYVMELRVNDGQAFSDPVSVSISVTPKK